ncbi:helix-turn-helix transcriptional regulator [Apilactobacillus micheneri]|uniref:XRE family transcriptional regulator n=1 Tax=Apilactobacillus micheneri TaxID=1899430 RepID=A0A9Q8MUA9_9LACO|nr:helix-turn-helix transcriptional regulator [Apilactobacillus micheneri]TPR39997.1 XRE family transcriptional regulator [Apilactobacillus micheneri]TPR41808.1 XRE family transcriptional regulator [Apilactobacillus micheneri]TPR44199.1 XRE family transcriptional regulator [Apilactobacillus micheneri]TPR45823.1 XRE family transcriptional regulator [Apilactobacillus micheneri]TPR50567.1 XRE family transcriptional regulator [Apilactobacillus micheneri]
MKISSQLKKVRKDKKLTQEYVANKINVSRKTISSWENGRGQPNSTYLKQLNSIYDTNLQLHYTQNKHETNNKYFNVMYFINLILFILCLYNLYTGKLAKISILQFIFTSFLCISYKINVFIKIKNKGKGIYLYLFIFVIFFIIIMNNLEFQYNFSNFFEEMPLYIGVLFHSLILTTSFFIITNYRNGK